MFYNRESVDSLLVCKNCQKRFDLPRLLPCGEVICELCLNNIKNLGSALNELKCPMCGNVHVASKNNGFPLHKALMSLLKLQPTDRPFRGVLIEELDDATASLNQRLSCLKQFQEASKLKIDSKKTALRSAVVDSAERKRVELKQLEEQMKATVDIYEKGIFDRMKEILDKFVQENEENVKVWTELNEDGSNLDNDVKLVKAIRDGSKFIKQVADKENALNLLIENLGAVSFKEGKKNITEEDIGCFSTPNPSTDSKPEEQNNELNCNTQ